MTRLISSLLKKIRWRRNSSRTRNFRAEYLLNPITVKSSPSISNKLLAARDAYAREWSELWNMPLALER
jgi:hypothetical protein